MGREHLDEETADRMLAGLVHPDDAPPGYSRTTSFLAELRAGLEGQVVQPDPATLRELSRRACPAAATDRGRGSGSLSRRCRRACWIAPPAIAVLLAAGAGAATAGALPRSASRIALAALDDLGLGRSDPGRDHRRPDPASLPSGAVRPSTVPSPVGVRSNAAPTVGPSAIGQSPPAATGEAPAGPVGVATTGPGRPGAPGPERPGRSGAAPGHSPDPNSPAGSAGPTTTTSTADRTAPPPHDDSGNGAHRANGARGGTGARSQDSAGGSGDPTKPGGRRAGPPGRA